MGIGKNTPSYKLDVAGDINASGGSVRASGVALTSDARLKTNVAELDDALSTVNKLRPVSYDKKATIESSNYDMHEIGFIAQEVQKILPDLVTEGKDKDKTLGLNYIELIPVLTKAIQEQQKEIDALKAEVKKLKK